MFYVFTWHAALQTYTYCTSYQLVNKNYGYAHSFTPCVYQALSAAEVATDPKRTGSDPYLTVFLRIWVGSRSSFSRRTGSGSEFGFAPPNNLGTKSALHPRRLFYFGLHQNFGRKNAPILSKDLLFFVGLHRNFDRKNA